jgi:hypothetical protein
VSLSPCSPSLPRRCSQWVTLTRPHAQAIVDDVTVDAAFRQECYSPADRSRFCPSDEHYIPTLLAVRGLEAEAACEASTTYTHWEGAGGRVGACVRGVQKEEGLYTASFVGCAQLAGAANLSVCQQTAPLAGAAAAAAPMPASPRAGDFPHPKTFGKAEVREGGRGGVSVCLLLQRCEAAIRPGMRCMLLHLLSVGHQPSHPYCRPLPSY